MKGVTVRVPASTSNLGPGLDTLGLALQIYLDVTVTDVTAAGGVVTHDDRTRVPGEDKLAQAYAAAARQEGVRVPGLRVEMRTDIPVRSGLGSSAAAVVAGLRLFESVAGPRSDEWRLRLASGLEGHPDNASPAVLGGLTVSCQCADGRVLAYAVPWPERIDVIVATPPDGLDTEVARRVLPSHVSREEAVFNLQRVALLLQSIRTGRFDHVGEALRDRLHQPYRQPLVPALPAVLALRHPSLMGAFLSGAGPSIVALTDGPAPDVADLIRAVYRDAGIAAHIRRVAVHQPV